MAENWKENLKKHRRAALFGIAAAIGIASAGGGLYLYEGERHPIKGSVVLDVSEEMTGREIADLLEEKGVIRSAFLFRGALLATGAGASLQHGHYRFEGALTMKEVIAELGRGEADARTVTIPEGATAGEIEEILKKAGLPGAAGFAAKAAEPVPYPYMQGTEAAKVAGEGFLFADTYDIPMDYDAGKIAALMYKRTDEILTSEIRAAAEKKKMSLHDLMTLASMVEREARFKEDQEPIASVMLARLAAGMPLQIDATVQYALGRQKAELLLSDTKIDSPYNTYLRQGLPPGPIGAPGESAIRAVLAAEPGGYLYYVAQKDGHHVFTKTYEEHQEKIAEIYGN